MASRILMNEFKALKKEKWVNIELDGNDDIFTWKIGLIVLNTDSFYYGGYFVGRMTFPANYPYSPPQFKFTPPIYHPNIYSNGELCISILHSPGDDEMSGELASERWSPAQRVESVLISIISLLDDAEVGSPANVEAGVQLRNDREGYRKRIAQEVERSKKDIPDEFIMPESHEVMASPPKVADKKDEDFWVDSGDEGCGDAFDDSGDSDSDMEYDDTGSEPEDDESS